MSDSSIPAQWPLIRRVSEWFTKTRAPNRDDQPLLEQGTGKEAERLRAQAQRTSEEARWLIGREPGSTELLCHMLQAAKIDESQIPPDVLRTLEHTCAHCEAKFYCADQLGRGQAGETFDEFCPNAERMRALQRSSS